MADTDILNRSGLISGSGVQLTAGRDIHIDALTRPFTSVARTAAGQVSGSNTEVGPQGAIVSRGELSVGAGRDVLLAGAVLSATGNARVSAGNKLLIDTVQTRQSTLDTGLNGVRRTEGTTGVASTVQTGGNLSLIAGADATLQAARLSAGKDLSVVSGGNLTIGAAFPGFGNEYWKSQRGKPRDHVQNSA